MFDDIPELYRDQTAKTPEEGWRYTQGDRDAHRPPELLTRDHVARKIVDEVKAGRGSPHGGVFLDISWIREKLPDAEARIKRKLPSMYHQFKELADIDITKESMEVGPTTHYVMGGVRVDSATQMSLSVPGLFAAGECGGGLHGANRLGGNSLSDLLVFGKRAGAYAAAFAREQDHGEIKEGQVADAEHEAIAPLERPEGESPYAIQSELEESMQELVGIVRSEQDMERGLEKVMELKERAVRVSAPGNRRYNPGWHTALDLSSLLVVSEAITRAALFRKESRGAQFREDFPEKGEEYGSVNSIVRKGEAGQLEVRHVPVPEMTTEQKEIVAEMK
jgi:succinate dehydrogenase / fumarate reductase flavoprotein subunit